MCVYVLCTCVSYELFLILHLKINPCICLRITEVEINIYSEVSFCNSHSNYTSVILSLLFCIYSSDSRHVSTLYA